MSRNLVLIGSDPCALYVAAGALSVGHRVTLFVEDREQLRRGTLPYSGLALGPTLQVEHSLGLAFWTERAAAIEEAQLRSVGVRSWEASGRFRAAGHAVDPRIKIPRLIEEVERRGACIETGPVEIEKLEEEAATADLVIASSGAGALGELLIHDEERSAGRVKPRVLAAVMVAGSGPRMNLRALKLVRVCGGGHLAIVPFLAEGERPATLITVAAKVGGPMDDFADVAGGEDVLARVRALVHRFAPLEGEALEGMSLLDDRAWMRTVVTPRVHRPVLCLPSGRKVLGMGRLVVCGDVLAGQEALRDSGCAQLILRRSLETTLDATWMESVFNEWWSAVAGPSTQLEAALLDEPSSSADSLDWRVEMGEGASLVDALLEPGSLALAAPMPAVPQPSPEAPSPEAPSPEAPSPEAPTHFFLNGGPSPAGEYFTSRGQYERELKHIFGAEWLCVGHVDSLRNPGDFLTRDVAGVQVLLTCDGKTVRAFYNLCRHRGCVLVDARAGHRNGFSCPYHRWAYDLGGKLIHAPGTEHLMTFRAEDNSLRPLAVEVRHGLIFVCCADSPGSLDEHLGDFPSFGARYELAALRCTVRKEYEVAANWKLIIQNINECLHFPALHDELHRVTDFDEAGTHHLKGNVIGAWQALRKDVTSVSMSGRSNRRPLPMVIGDDRVRVNWITLLPNLLFTFTSDYVIMQWAWPLSENRSRVWNEWYFHPDAVAQADFSHEEVFALWDKANLEDWTIIERTQQGVQSIGWTGGAYALDEEVLYDFDQYVSARLSR